MRLLIIVGIVAGILLAIPLVMRGFASNDVISGMKPGSDAKVQDAIAASQVSLPDWRAVLTMLPNEVGDGASYYFQAETEAERLMHTPYDPKIAQLRQQLSVLRPFAADPRQDPQEYEWNLGNMVAAGTAFLGSKKQTCSYTQAGSFRGSDKEVTVTLRMVTRGLCYLGDHYVYTDPSSALAYYEAALIHAGRNLDDAEKPNTPEIAMIASVGATQMALNRLESFYMYSKQNANVTKIKSLSQDLLAFMNYRKSAYDAMRNRK